MKHVMFQITSTSSVFSALLAALLSCVEENNPFWPGMGKKQRKNARRERWKGQKKDDESSAGGVDRYSRMCLLAEMCQELLLHFMKGA